MKNNELLNELKKIHRLESHKKIKAQFNEVAEKIFNEYILIIKNKENESKYRITEIEFYLHCDGHLDPYIHGHNRQSLNAHWYFHRKGRGGLDITFGKNNNHKIHGGILIRSLQNIKAHYDYINGPLLVSERIIKNAESPKERKKLKTEIEEKEIFNSKNSIYLIKRKQLPKNTIYKAPRVGLLPYGKGLEWSKYIMKPYRYLLYPERINNGKELLILSIIKNRGIKEITYYSKSKLRTYIKKYCIGNKLKEKKNNNQRKEFLNDLSKNTIKYLTNEKCKLYGLLNEGYKKWEIVQRKELNEI